jgi:hypothetical protein
MGELVEYIPDNNEEHSIDISNQEELYDYTEEDTTPRSLLDETNDEGNDISSKELRIEIEKNNDVKNNYVGCIVM